MVSYDCDPAGTALKGWGTVTGTNSSGFTALPGGLRYDLNKTFSVINSDGYFWSSSMNDSSSALRRRVNSSETGISRYSLGRASGISVRCVQ